MPNTLINSEQVDIRIEEIATEITKEYADQSPLFVALLRGAAPFASKLMFAVAQQDPDFHPEIDYMMVSTYGDGRTAGEPHIVTDLAPTTTVTGREVIIIDDVLDKGITADFVASHLKNRGASSVKLAVLVSKNTERLRDIEANYCGFDLPDVWLAGMGMDDNASGLEYYRWHDEIYQMK